jgi:hypothetical protein
MPLKRRKNGGYKLVRPTAAERTWFMSGFMPVAISARSHQALSRGQSVRLEVEKAADHAPQAPEDINDERCKSMGKLISISVFCARRDREGPWTEEDAARQRDLTERQRNRFNPDWIAEWFAKRSKPPVQPGSKVQLRVVSRRRP